MRSLFLLFTCAFTPFAAAAPLLTLSGTYSAGSSKEPAVAIKPLANRSVAVNVLYESFADGRPEPLVRSETTQRLRIRNLSDEEGFTRRELLFQDFKSTTRMQMPGAAKPFETKQDLGAYLFDQPIRARWKGGAFASFENLAAVREKLQSSVKDSVSRQGLKVNLSDDALRAALSSSGEEPVCLDGLKGKVPGAKWERSREAASTQFHFSCEFSGWAEADGRPLLLVKFTMPKQKETKAQPNGAPAAVETTGSGLIVAEPKSGETLVRLETEVFAQPGPKESAALAKKGRAGPKARSFVHTTTHAYAE